MWYAVRHVLKNAGSYEERITLWDASSFDDAIALARDEAVELAAEVMDDGEVLDLFQAYLLPEAPGHGQEAFSLIRESDLDPAEYVATFFATGAELEQDLTSEP